MESTLIADSASKLYLAFTSILDSLSMLFKFDTSGSIIWSQKVNHGVSTMV